MDSVPVSSADVTLQFEATICYAVGKLLLALHVSVLILALHAFRVQDIP